MKWLDFQIENIVLAFCSNFDLNSEWIHQHQAIVCCQAGPYGGFSSCRELSNDI